MDWAAIFGGRFNAAKSVRVVFGKLDPAQTPAPALPVDAADLCPSTTHRHLGITLDPRLSFQTHINSVTSNFRRRVVLLSYMSPNLTPARLYSACPPIARLYKGYVRPSIEYGSPLWNNKLAAGNIDTLERLQARVARQYFTPSESSHSSWHGERVWRCWMGKSCVAAAYTLPQTVLPFHPPIPGNPK